MACANPAGDGDTVMTRDHFRTSAILVALVLAATLAGGVSAPAAQPASGCSLFAASNPSGPARGTVKAPFQSVQALIDALRPGQIGCLLGGTYYGDVRFSHGGRRRAPITLTRAPGASATIVGHIYIPTGSNDVRIDGLTLDGRNAENLPSPTVESSNDQFVRDVVTNYHTAICFGIGGAGSAQARNTLIAHDRIHDCGVLPATNHEHGIYVASSVGARIIDNVIVDNADRGIQLYWNAQRTTIAGNIIDHNGEGVLISGDYGQVSSHNLIIGNLITDSLGRADVESYWPNDAKGTGNLVIDNCVFGGLRAIDRSAGGFIARRNRHVDPGYVDPAVGNYALSKGSRCAGLLVRAASAARAYEHRIR